MPLERPIKMGPNSYYFHGELWTAEEITQRFGPALIPTCSTSAYKSEDESQAPKPALTNA